MSERYLVILEVSQKQAYIFSSNKLKDNIINSACIVKVTDSSYFAEKCADLYVKEDNYVYAGGGHTVLEFDSEEHAKSFLYEYSKSVMIDYPDMEIFTTLMKYDKKETVGNNLKELTKRLEAKKAIRVSSFHQGTFGIEKLDTNTLKPKLLKAPLSDKEERELLKNDCLIPQGFTFPEKFEDMGSSFISVVHIDGNSMGKRVTDLYNMLDENHTSWEEYKKKLREFSDGIDSAFKEAYKEMIDEVIANMVKASYSNNMIPVRKVIISGDDVCFVSRGEIGIECARIFIEKLMKKTNDTDKQNYYACGGIAIVHKKYPFFRAYELAEQLCSNAKKFNANIDKEGNGAHISSIDWHISYGELEDSVEDVRNDYATEDGATLELRPYIIDGDKNLTDKEPYRQYKHFTEIMRRLSDEDDAFARGKIKQLRNVLKKGEKETGRYLKFNSIDSITRISYRNIFAEMDLSKIGSGVVDDGRIFLTTYDGKKRSILFDAIEIMDCFEELEEGYSDDH